MNQPVDALRDALGSGEPTATATVIKLTAPTGETLGTEDESSLPALGTTVLVRSNGSTLGTTGDVALDEAVARDARTMLDAGSSAVRTYRLTGEGVEVSLFHQVFVAPARMVIVGATEVAAALARVARHVGHHVVVCDARPAFATARRFPEADEVVVDWADRYLATLRAPLGPRDAICVLSHDHKFDVPALVAALGTRAGYIGAMGSRASQADRAARLRELGVTDEQLARIMGPIGIDIGARSPEEMAIAIVAEIIALREGRRVPSLRDATGPIHGPS